MVQLFSTHHYIPTWLHLSSIIKQMSVENVQIKDTHQREEKTHTHSRSHMGHSINELAVLMSAVEWMFTATLKPSALINTLPLCSVMRQPYDFTYPRPWSESLQDGDSDELIIPLSCNYPPPLSPSFSLSLLILLFPSQSLLSFVCSSPFLTLFMFHKSPYTCKLISLPSFFSTICKHLWLHLICDINPLSSLCFFVYLSNLLTLSSPAYRGNSCRQREWEYSMRVPRFI